MMSNTVICRQAAFVRYVHTSTYRMRPDTCKPRILSRTLSTWTPPHLQSTMRAPRGLGCAMGSINRESSINKALIEKRRFSSSPRNPEDTDFSKLRRLEDANPERIHGIQVNPDSIGSNILPGNLVYKFYKWTGNTRKVPLELVHGYFWMLNDLKATNGKPTLSNEKLIPAEEAQTFPMLMGLESLSRKKTDLPYFLIADKDVKCSLVNISFRDSGYKNIDSWMDPFSEAFEGDRSVNSIKVSITERWSLYMLRGSLANLMRRNTPAREHDRTLLYFGSDVDDFRDVLRMHNLMANYVFLVDNLGRIRFAGSGVASSEEVERVIGFAKELTSARSGSKPNQKPRKG